MLHIRLRPTLTTATRLAAAAARSSSTSAASRFIGPNGYTGDYLADRRGGEEFLKAAEWDMESLVEIPIVRRTSSRAAGPPEGEEGQEC